MFRLHEWVEKIMKKRYDLLLVDHIFFYSSTLNRQIFKISQLLFILSCLIFDIIKNFFKPHILELFLIRIQIILSSIVVSYNYKLYKMISNIKIYNTIKIMLFSQIC